MTIWMRWCHGAGLLLALGFALFLTTEINRQDERISALRSDLDTVHTYLPALIRSELAAQEERLVSRFESLLVKK